MADVAKASVFLTSKSGPRSIYRDSSFFDGYIVASHQKIEGKRKQVWQSHVLIFFNCGNGTGQTGKVVRYLT